MNVNGQNYQKYIWLNGAYESLNFSLLWDECNERALQRLDIAFNNKKWLQEKR